MTDKQIIIDGVNVSGCCHQGKDNTCTCPHYKKECGRNPNCHYKIMQRQTKKLDEFYKRELEIKQKLFRKEQECEELKKQLTILDDKDVVVEITVKQFEEYKNLKQTLTEIKEIVKEQLPTVNYNFAKSMHPEMFNCYEQILQEISEVEE